MERWRASKPALGRASQEKTPIQKKTERTLDARGSWPLLRSVRPAPSRSMRPPENSAARRNLARTRLEDAALALLPSVVALVCVGRDHHTLTRRHRPPLHQSIELL